MLQIDPEKRISAEDALKHSYFKDLPQAVYGKYKTKI